jgi:N-acetylglucosaminyldiphosphoundecaprenol N-acetyl-beta-D-mannosaminyltransferase
MLIDVGHVKVQAKRATPVMTQASVASRGPVQFRFDTTTITVNVPDRAALETAVLQALQEQQGFALATINLDHLVKLGESSVFRTAYAAQTMVVADGNPIVWLSYLAGRPVGLVPGSDMVMPLARLAAKAGVTVALVGSSDASLEAAARNMMRQVPGLQIPLRIAPPYGFDPTGPLARDILQRVRAHEIGLCFLALGAPKQEYMAALGRELAPDVGFASVGAGLDFLGGLQMRAPPWVRAIAMEWLWRALSNPRRMIPRYAACAAILPQQIVAALRLRFSGRP